MGYRDYIEAQKKYIETKKEALLGKDEHDQNQKQYGDPPPARTNRWWIGAFVPFLLLPFVMLYFGARLPALAENDTLTLALLGTEAEFIQIQNWLEPEIVSNSLIWTLTHYTTQRELEHHLIYGPVPDLLLVDADFAERCFLSGELATLREKEQNPNLENSFHPLWAPRPFQKIMGLALPNRGNVEQARHLCTIIKHFVPAFNP